MPINEKWLAKVEEDTLEPQLKICDPHHHLWQHPNNTYLAEEFLQDINSGHKISSTVFVECMSSYYKDSSKALAPVGETKFIEELAERNVKNRSRTDIAKAIVGFADLLLGDAVEKVLDAHLEESPYRFKGIRHACGWDSSDQIRNSHTNPKRFLYLDETFQKGFAKLFDYGFTFDAWLYHPQHQDLITLAKSFPNQIIIVDHVGGPLGIGPYQNKQQSVFQCWKKTISQLAECENIFMKLGGLSMATSGFEWHKKNKPPTSLQLAEATAPYLNFCIEKFGTKRCMFESNFPVDKISCSYNILWNSFKRITGSFSIDEKRDLFHDVAVKIYDINESLT